MISWQEAFAQLPMVAILRGLRHQAALPIVGALIDEGFRIIEVPLNSPDPFETIGAISKEFADQALIGAGTVLTADNAERTADAGGRLIVAPNLDAQVAAVAHERGLAYCPGVMTPTEIFDGISLGADALKLFPAELIGVTGMKALRSVVPPNVKLLAVGGVSPSNVQAYVDAGASGFGIGSSLFKPDSDADQVREAARDFFNAAQQAGLTESKPA